MEAAAGSSGFDRITEDHIKQMLESFTCPVCVANAAAVCSYLRRHMLQVVHSGGFLQRLIGENPSPLPGFLLDAGLPTLPHYPNPRLALSAGSYCSHHFSLDFIKTDGDLRFSLLDCSKGRWLIYGETPSDAQFQRKELFICDPSTGSFVKLPQVSPFTSERVSLPGAKLILKGGDVLYSQVIVAFRDEEEDEDGENTFVFIKKQSQFLWSTNSTVRQLPRWSDTILCFPLPEVKVRAGKAVQEVVVYDYELDRQYRASIQRDRATYGVRGVKFLELEGGDMCYSLLHVPGGNIENAELLLRTFMCGSFELPLRLRDIQGLENLLHPDHQLRMVDANNGFVFLSVTSDVYAVRIRTKQAFRILEVPQDFSVNLIRLFPLWIPWLYKKKPQEQVEQLAPQPAIDMTVVPVP